MNTKIAIHHTGKVHKDSFSFRWMEYLKSKNIEYKVIDFKQSDILSKIADCDGAMWHWFHTPDDKQAAPKILDAIEFGLYIPVFPNKETRWHYDEKVAQHYLFDAIKTDKIKSWVFWDKSSAINFLETADYPLVFKLSVGAGSSNVLKIDQKHEAIKLVEILFGEGFTPYTINEFEEKLDIQYPKFSRRLKDSINYMIKRRLPVIQNKPKQHWYYLLQKNYAYFQEFIPDNAYDIRITVIGGRAFGFVRHNRPGDFRASGSGKIDYDLKKIPLEAVSLAFSISQKNNFQSMAYDFLKDKTGKVLLNEISYCFQNKAVYDCEGFWKPDLSWHVGHVWSEDAIIEDFIGLIQNQKQI